MFILKVPGINALGKTKGCERACDLVLNTLKQEIYSNESGKILDFSKLEIREIKLEKSNLEFNNKSIYERAFKIFKNKSQPIFIGGDHSISYGLTRAFFDYVQDSGKEPCLIIFDAHPDLMPFCKEPTHEEWLRKLIDDKFPVENILLVGTRNSHKQELDFLKEKKIRQIKMNQLLENLEDSCDLIMEFSRGKELYVSIDIDVLDPVFAPGTGYCEPGGLTSREFLYILQRINKVKNLRALDIVEINPEKDINNKTIKLGAKILSEFI